MRHPAPRLFGRSASADASPSFPSALPIPANMDRTPRVLTFVSIFAIALAACDASAPEGEVASGASAAAPSAIGHLTFATQADFDRAYKELLDVSADVAATTKSSASFTSMLAAEQADAAAAESGAKADTEVRLRVVEDPYLASLLSPEGVVQIGAAVYKVGPTKVFTGTEAQVAEFQSKTEEQLSSQGYPSVAVQRASPSDASPQSVDAANSGASDARCTGFTGSNGSSYKVCGTSYITNWGFLRSAGATTDVLKRGWFGIYYPVKGDQLTLTSTYQLAYVGQPLPPAQTKTATATRSWILARIYHYGASYNGPQLRGSVNSTHRATHASRTAQSTTAASKS